MTNPTGWQFDMLNMAPAWALTSGAGVLVGIVDDGVDADDPKLAPNYNAAVSYDFASQANDGKYNASDWHGTKVAGAVLDVASAATIGAFTIGYGSSGGWGITVAALETAGQKCDVVNCSWGWTQPFYDNFNQAWAAGGLEALTDGVTKGRDGLGTVFVFSAGNDRASGGNADYHNFTNSPYTICVTGVASNGYVSDWADPGACILVSAPDVSIPATVANAAPTTFSGTSAAAPLVSGIVAQMLAVNPKLTWLDVQDILVRTAKMTNPTDAAWQTNAAGLKFNLNCGFGCVDAGAAVASAAVRKEWPASEIKTTTTAIAGTVQITDDFEVTSVLVQCSLPQGDSLTITSPSGTVGKIVNALPAAATDFTFMAAMFWGEDSAGIWKIDGVATLTVNGVRCATVAQPAPDPAPVTVSNPATDPVPAPVQTTGTPGSPAPVTGTPAPVVTPPVVTAPTGTSSATQANPLALASSRMVNVMGLYALNEVPDSVLFGVPSIPCNGHFLDENGVAHTYGFSRDWEAAQKVQWVAGAAKTTQLIFIIASAGGKSSGWLPSYIRTA